MNLGPPSHLVVAASGWVGRAVGALAQIIMINLVITHIGTVDYAIFAILYGLVGWFQVADFGLGVSLQNFISEYRAKGLPHAQAVHAISTLTLMLFFVQALLLALSAGWIGPWLLRQFAIPEVSKSHLFLICSVLLLTFSLGQVATRIYYAEKRGYVTNLIFAGAQILGCLLAWGSMRLGQTPPLPWALGAFLLPSALVMTGLFISILSRKAPGPALNPEQLRFILRRAVGFAGFSLSAAFVLQIDVVIISQFLGPQEIASYTLLSKILAFVFAMYS